MFLGGVAVLFAVAALLLGSTEAIAVPGDPDAGFSADGKTTTNFNNVTQFAEARGVAMQSSGKLVLGGSANDGGFISHFALIRLNTDGTQDMAFGSGGPDPFCVSTGAVTSASGRLIPFGRSDVRA